MKNKFKGSKARQMGVVFLVTVSLVLLSFGTISVAYIAWPMLVNSTSEAAPYFPPLPVAADKETTLAVRETPDRQLYPELIPIGESNEGNWIRIPSIGVKVPLVMSRTLTDKDVLEVLAEGTVLYPNGVVPGRPGNTFIAAHSTGEPWKGKYRFAFLRINELTRNNLIHIDWQNTRYTYRLVSSNIIDPDATTLVESTGQVPRVTLMACWPLWSTKQRMLVTGVLANVTKLTPTPE